MTVAVQPLDRWLAIDGDLSCLDSVDVFRFEDHMSLTLANVNQTSDQHIWDALQASLPSKAASPCEIITLLGPQQSGT